MVTMVMTAFDITNAMMFSQYSPIVQMFVVTFVVVEAVNISTIMYFWR